ncbi:MAG: hypothetical protein K8S87_07940 [Planctomycetes bacterium]|nr:hypothetical protein [Planctomycetota bacterium]
MKTFSIILIIFVSLCFSANQVLASDDFQVQPPVFPRDLQEDESYSNRYKEFTPLFVPPLIYFTLAAQTERTWFDRRLAWDSYSAQFVFDTGMFGFKLQGAFSGAGPDDFSLVDARVDLYAYFPEQFEAFKIGGGFSYFDSKPYVGQDFLENQHLAAFVNAQFLVFEAKFAMLINDEFYNGGLFELKLHNALRYSGLGYQNKLKMDEITKSILYLVLPSEICITSAFGLPAGNDGWGWFVKNRYVFLKFSAHENESHWGICGEFYWAYKDGFSNDRVSEGWEFGIKFTLVGL